MASLSTTLSLSASLSRLAELSNALYDFVTPLALDPALVYQVDLASCEAFTNIVKHAVNYDESQHVIITLSYDNHCLTLTLSDAGMAIPDDVLRGLRRSPGLSPDPLIHSSWPEGGMGLILIQSMMDDVSYSKENGRNIMTLIKKFPSEYP
ncbi:ATP-binding protein [Serratia fonticola]|uniref:ATP-binding protein n=1 Tax=Serratia fonticola TaxID=47917 RepID=A0ABY9PHE5_SERFO|nr:ATP-binding protein [Serratia fonticola]WMT12678.1 ATP-binding protein [Serratia fonticola]